MKTELQKLATIANKKAFTHNGIPGTIDIFGFVQYGGMGFHKDAAHQELLKSINKALEEIQKIMAQGMSQQDAFRTVMTKYMKSQS